MAVSGQFLKSFEVTTSALLDASTSEVNRLLAKYSSLTTQTAFPIIVPRPGQQSQTFLVYLFTVNPDQRNQMIANGDFPG